MLSVDESSPMRVKASVYFQSTLGFHGSSMTVSTKIFCVWSIFVLGKKKKPEGEAHLRAPCPWGGWMSEEGVTGPRCIFSCPPMENLPRSIHHIWNQQQLRPVYVTHIYRYIYVVDRTKKEGETQVHPRSCQSSEPMAAELRPRLSSP